MKRAAALVLAFLVLVGGVGSVGMAAGQSDGSSAAALGLEELAPGGEKPANAPASVRQNGNYGEVVVKYLPTGLLVDESEDSPSWRYLEPGTSVKRNKIQIWSKQAYNAEDTEYTVRVAYWQKGTRTVERGNTTETIPAAVNVTTHTSKVNFGPGYDYATIKLRPHYDGQVRTTMCIQRPDEANCLAEPGPQRWSFYHHSSKATQALEINTRGGQLGWGLGLLVLPFFGMTAVTLYGGRQLIRTAKSGARISAIWYVVAGIVLLVFVIAAWDWVSNTLITAPWLFAAAGGILLGVMAVEWFGDRTYGALFVRLRLADAHDPRGMLGLSGGEDGDEAATDGGTSTSEAPGVLVADVIPQRFARGEDGVRTAIRGGLRKFLARARGARADLEVNGHMETKIDVEHGPFDELFFLDPEAEDSFEYKPEGHELSLPPLLEYGETEDGERYLETVNVGPYALGLGALAGSWFAGGFLTGSGTLGLLVGAALLVTLKVAKPVGGYLRAKLAPLHYHSAIATMLTHATELGDARTWENLHEQLAREKAGNRADKKQLADKESRSQMDELMDRYVGPDSDARNGSSESTGASDD